MGFTAVLFDWRGTLVATQSTREWVTDGLLRADRTADIDAIIARIDEADGPEHRLDTPGMDADRDLHEHIFFEVMADAGIDPALAAALYASESDPARNPWAADAAPTITALKARGVLIGVVSDIHFDIRQAFATVGLRNEIDAFALSYEVGAQKPSAEIYQYALESLGVPASEALMVGDRAHPDGGAVEHGMTVLLVPPLQSPEDQRLGRMFNLPDSA
ncbi:HAD family hydrolase [Microbacterium sp. NPDC057650]|uniref:HAD family hydrolase n=1 Tax=unclassified Microbacterium TaxID=2609290 RepID=UPI00366CD65A